jgi:hypothetical protein
VAAVDDGKKMTKAQIADAIATAPKSSLARLLEAVKSCPKSIRALAAKSKKDEAQREVQKKKKKDKGVDLICL